MLQIKRPLNLKILFTYFSQILRGLFLKQLDADVRIVADILCQKPLSKLPLPKRLNKYIGVDALEVLY